MQPRTVVRPTAEAELPELLKIEVQSYSIYRTLGMDDVASAQPSLEGFQTAHHHGRLLIADHDHKIAGFIETERVDETLYIAGVCVHPDFARQGIGAVLLESASGLAAREGLERMSLTTFADVPWNGPYYRRLGWTVLPDAEASEGLAAIRARQRQEGWERWPRQTMIKRVVVDDQ